MSTPYDADFAAAGQAHGVDPALLREVARQESGFNPAARSPAGAEGIMQFEPGTAAGLGIDPWNAAQAIDGAARLLRQYLDKYGSVDLALAAYNAGPGAVDKYGGVPPFAETQAYVRAITGRLHGASGLTGGGIGAGVGTGIGIGAGVVTGGGVIGDAAGAAGSVVDQTAGKVISALGDAFAGALGGVLRPLLVTGALVAGGATLAVFGVWRAVRRPGGGAG